VRLAPEFAFVLQHPEKGVCGYTLGALDTAAFYRRMEGEYLPALRAAHPLAATPPSEWTAVESVRGR
jgi:hypothetical protein